MRAMTKDGVTIVAILEIVGCTVGVDSESFSRTASGEITFDYDDTGAKMDWDSQEPIKGRGGRQFVDDDGHVLGEDQIVLIEDVEPSS